MTTPIAQIAKSIRAELKSAFPNHKFSVTCKNFSMGDSFRVAWIDGVTKVQVEEITNKYKQISRCESSGEILGGGNTYSHIERNYSPTVMQPELDRIAQQYVIRNWQGEAVDTMDTHIDSDGSMNLADCYTVGDNRGNTVRSLLAETLDKTSYYQAAKTKQTVNKTNFGSRPIEDNEIVMEYLFPENAIAADCNATVTENPEKNGVEIRFDRKPSTAILDILKSNGFRYSRNLNIWYAKRTPKTLAIARNFGSISVESTPIVESTVPTDFSYLLGSTNDRSNREATVTSTVEIDRKISTPPQQVFALMPAAEIADRETTSTAAIAIEPEVIKDPNLWVSEFRQAADSGKTISLLAFATAIRRERTLVQTTKSS